VVVGEFVKGEKNPKVIGIGEAETRGLRHGYVVHYTDAVVTLRNAIALAEKSSGIKIKRAFVSVSGISLRGNMSVGTAIVSKADGEVTGLDIRKALEDAEQNLTLINKKIIQVTPVAYKLDGTEVQGRIEGMRGNKLEVKALLVTYSVQHLEDLLEVLAGAGVEAIDVIPGPVADGRIALSDKQKIVGSALVNIGAESVTLAVFENGILMSLHSYSIGGADITNDIALGLKIPLERAEIFKLGNVDEDFSKKKLDEIIEARLSDIFELIENHLKKIKRSELLPAGIVFVGGGANIKDLAEFSKSTLRLPSAIGASDLFGNAKTKLRDPSWFTALGLIQSGEETEGYSEGSFLNIFKDMKNSMKSSLKQLMP
jgi:cell division protein FtsA